MLTESTRSDKYFEYLGEFNFIFEMNLGYESGEQVVALGEKNRSHKSRTSVPLRLLETILTMIEE